MYRRLDFGTRLGGMQGVALAGILGWSAISLAQSPAQTPAAKTMPDAQVQANVLKGLAGAADLANQPIRTTAVYGVVTLSGSVQTEAQRTEAETIVSTTSGVQKVIDEMTLSGDGTAAQPAQAGSAAVADAQGNAGVLQSDGTMAPAQGSPDGDNTAAPAGQAAGPNYGPGAPEYRQPYQGAAQNPSGTQQYPGGYGPPPGYGGGAAAGGDQPQGYPQQPGGYPQQAQGYPQQPGYPQQQGYGSQPGYPQQQSYPQQPGYAPQPVYGGQQAGVTVTVPSGAMMRVRINQSLDSGRTQPGAKFDGIVVNDVVADGAIAIPRGAAIQGTVVDAKKSGALAGRGELSLQLTSVTLAGKSYPIVSNVWNQHGGDKTTETVNKAAVGGVLGALVGAAAGGGEGAAIGAGVGGALGVGSSAASGNGQVYVPSEGLLTFQLAQPATLATVSQQEMDRLAQGVPPGAGPQGLRRRAYPYPVYGPGYYRAYPYSPYPYPY